MLKNNQTKKVKRLEDRPEWKQVRDELRNPKSNIWGKKKVIKKF